MTMTRPKQEVETCTEYQLRVKGRVDEERQIVGDAQTSRSFIPSIESTSCFAMICQCEGYQVLAELVPDWTTND